jgi:hypothetical protein
MDSDKDTDHGGTIRQRPPTYWQCRRAIGWLKRFQGLLIHRERWGTYMDSAPPIEELLPGVRENDRPRVIDREINRLIPLVSSVLHYISIPTVVSQSDYEHDLTSEKLALKEVERNYDLVEHYFELPRQGRGRQQFFTLLMQTMERGIGGFEESRQAAIRRAFSPITWLAWVVEIPIKVLERAGVPMEDASSKGVQVIAWILRLGMVGLVALIGAKLGISVPWERAIAFFK